MVWILEGALCVCEPGSVGAVIVEQPVSMTDVHNGVLLVYTRMLQSDDGPLLLAGPGAIVITLAYLVMIAPTSVSVRTVYEGLRDKGLYLEPTVLRQALRQVETWRAGV